MTLEAFSYLSSTASTQLERPRISFAAEQSGETSETPTLAGTGHNFLKYSKLVLAGRMIFAIFAFI
jgi:hypothetical protein